MHHISKMIHHKAFSFISKVHAAKAVFTTSHSSSLLYCKLILAREETGSTCCGRRKTKWPPPSGPIIFPVSFVAVCFPHKGESGGGGKQFLTSLLKPMPAPNRGSQWSAGPGKKQEDEWAPRKRWKSIRPGYGWICLLAPPHPYHPMTNVYWSAQCIQFSSIKKIIFYSTGRE